MKNELRGKLDLIEREVNRTLESRGLDVQCRVVAYSHRPSVDYEHNTQEIINNIAARSDIFLLIANNGDIVGKYTMQELDTAESQYKNRGAPYIKAFIAKKGDEESVSVSYRDMDDVVHNDFEAYVDRKSGRYVECVLESNLASFVQDWLVINIEYMYAFMARTERHAYVVLRVQDNAEAEAVLEKAGYHIITEADVNKL
jgi:hypothetical protein